MDRVIDSSQVSPGRIAHVGIAIHKHEQHIGLLYRVAVRQPVLLLHLPWHNKLCSDAVTADYVLWVDPSIPEDRAKVVAAYCRRIWRKNEANGLPYGLSHPNRFFDHTGTVLGGPAKLGLTCATFVLAVFDTARLPLIRYETWRNPTDKDIKRQRKLAKRLEDDSQVTAEHVRAFAREIGNIRYAPLEVAGAATSDSLPTDYEYAARVATHIRRRLATMRVSGA